MSHTERMAHHNEIQAMSRAGSMHFNLIRSLIMKRSYKIAASIFATLGLGLAVATAYAHPGGEGGMGPGMMGGMMQGMQNMQAMHAMHGAMGPGAMGPGAMGPGAMGPGMMGQGMNGPGAGQMYGQQLMTPEEQTAMREKMRAAATPEERQKIAEANHAEMQKRAKEKGITLPDARFPHRGFGPNAAQKQP
jgi:hypothetical protein